LTAPDRLLAARLALLALRATIGESIQLAADRALLDAADSPVSTEAAARLLASKRKPLVCDAEARDGTLVVRCRTVTDADTGEMQYFEMRRREHEERGGYLGFLDEHYGVGDHLVKVFGRDESLLVPRSAVERWSREYRIRRGGHSADLIDNPWSEGKPEYVEARREGAKGVLRFSSPGDSHMTVRGFKLPIDDSASESERHDADEQLIEMAKNYRHLLTAIVASGSLADLPPPRSKWGEWQRKQAQEMPQRIIQVAEMIKQVFHGREMPPDVAAFVDECAKHLGPPSS